MPSFAASTRARGPPPSKLVTTLQAGDRVVMETAGGGGYGDPAARDPAKLRGDLADGKISTEGAKAYGITPAPTG